ncbi:MAG TPA: serine/threonine-protein kinase [Polyangiaceae bacterium]|jgi:serine/threonine-protein kinase|nr:serine/threonine-protein kinase [Polyangiaceae bacterium]
MTGNDSSAAPDEPRGPGDESVPDPLIGKVIAERYRVDDRLGVGGMGTVYRAEHVLMKKPVAVKVLHRELTVLGEIVKRFEREAIAAGRIDHPNVTLATDFGKLEDGSFYLVLEYVPGRSLTQALKEDGPFPVERGLFVTRQMAAALAAAHAADVVHRDLKPDNVMLIERGGTKDFVKVLDFGIAKVSGEGATGQLTRLGAVFGTPQYMAPEQAAGKIVDGRADLYSLGLVLYELLSGKPAFSAQEIVGLLTKQLTETPAPLPASVDADVAALVMKLVEKDPANRVQSATELVAIIDARLGPVVFAPDSTVLGIPSVKGPSPVAFAQTTPLDVGPAPASSSGGAGSPKRRTLWGAWLDAPSLVERAARGDTVTLGGRTVSLRLVLAVGAAVLVGVPLAITELHGHEEPAPLASSAARPAPPPAPELAELLLRAKTGDRAAIASLESRPSTDRTALEWAAIGLGHDRLGETRIALPSLRAAVRADPGLAKDRDLIRVVRTAVDDDATRTQAMNFAADSLGPDGADLLYDVWTATAEKTDATSQAKSLLSREDVRAHASKPLLLALDLRRLTRCDDIKQLLPDAIASGDDRSTRPLMALSSRKGCGFLHLGDCFSCLRGDDALGEAQKAVQQRKSPRF